MLIRPMLLLTAAALTVASLAAADPQPAPRSSPAELREDFEIMRHALEEAHPGLYRYTPKPTMDRIFDAAEKRIDRPMDGWEFYRLTAPVIASIHCGHTRIEIPETLQTELNTTRRLLPMVVRVLGGRAWVYRDLSNPAGVMAGRELLAVNGVQTRLILDSLFASIPSDGFGRTLQPRTIDNFRFAGLLERVYGFDGQYDVITSDGAGGRPSTIRLDGATIPDLQKRLAERYRDPPEQNGEFELLDDGRIARLKLRGFGGSVDDSAKIDVRTFFKSSFASMQAHGTKTLILDLRDNGGGEDALGKILLAYLVDKPFDYYADLVLNDRGFSFGKYMAAFDSIPSDLVEKRADGKYHAIGHPNWGTPQPIEPHFGGKVLVLANGGSFSTTCEFLSHVRDLGRATFIGEETGGAYVGNTSGGAANLVLPHSKLRVHIPILRYDLAVKPAQPFGRGIMSDVTVSYTIAELIAGDDKELARALARARATN